MKKLVFVGAGSMAEAMISGIGASGLLPGEQIWATNKQDADRLKSLELKYGIKATYDLEMLFKNADAVVLAMKPKDAAAAVGEIKSYLPEGMLIISVLAGVSIAAIETAAEKSLAVARAMPNTSAAIGKSATAMAVNSHVSEAQKVLIQELFNTIGLTTIVDEYQLDAVTGLSGSGPAYIYYLVEAMEQSAAEIGLDKQTAKQLIIQTLLGAAEMLTKSDKEPAQLRFEVTSPGGTTEAGISILEQHGVQSAFVSCIKEATAQSRRLGHLLGNELAANRPL
ncbi:MULTISPECIES: pyrroline-5-carboxylate reductase [unclassified Bacillus (in: firmicutes)]|uniref:pyrroline-5-carboxylate reductase n=1 Tax=unclassified Bacillus (in: firmicutes) TaxID=185979 RepID=UPI001BED251B|nr:MULTISPECIES: pyrroline-5-carboxylate reductase [unclassified Bacillus (in: firmicutes)]MBT2638778.1 pyrroline-5-carboxylate reductase [Bacillus sp. ISL-39]MBT2660921.1 pyrroline-5-carboxylate reductase [Bacillus sp. ISL-45]